MINSTQDIRIRGVRQLVPPRDLLEQVQLGEVAAQIVARGRAQVCDVLRGRDDRLLIVVGPCSIHDVQAAQDYAALLAEAAQLYGSELLIVMRTYLEKPRTTIGWKGLLHDPSLDGGNDVNEGLRVARRLLRELAENEVLTATEFLEPLAAQYLADLITWGAIGARTTESPIHRHLASGLSMPIGFKNGTDGSAQAAVDAICAAAHAHQFFGMANDGSCVLVETTGNTDTHLILRGGRNGPNYQTRDVGEAARLLEAAGQPPRIMIDCSHGNSRKDHRIQAAVATSVAEQVATGSCEIIGLMLESFLFEGRQNIGPLADLQYGQSVTDACLGWLQTEQVLATAAKAVQRRRSRTRAAKAATTETTNQAGRVSP